MNRENKLIAFILFGILLIPQLSQAERRDRDCSLGRSRDFYIFSSLERNSSGAYDLKGRPMKWKVRVPSCKSQVGKLFMVRTGVDVLDPIGDSSLVYFDTTDAPNKECRAENLPANVSLKIEKNFTEKIIKKNHLFRSCVQTRLNIVEGNGHIKGYIPTEQPDCKVKIIDEQNAYLEGPRCYFRVVPGNNFSLWYEANPKCNKSTYLTEKDVYLGHVNGLSSLSIVQKIEDGLNGLKPVGQNRIHYTLEGKSEFFTMDDSYSEFLPNTPGIKRFMDAHLGSFSFEQAYGFFDFRIGLIANNICPRTCKSGVCTGICDFRTPLAGLVSIFELKGRRKKFIHEQYFGNVIPGHWSGMTNFQNSIQFEDRDRLMKGGKYQVDIAFGDPQYDMAMAKKGMKDLFSIKLPNLTINLGENGAGGEIPSAGAIGGMPSSPGMGTLPSFDGGVGFGDLTEMFKSAFSIGNNVSEIWPPYYQQICSSDMKKCLKSRFEDHTVISLTFDIVDEWDYAGSPGLVYYKIDNLKITRKSRLEEEYSYVLKDGKLPSFICE